MSKSPVQIDRYHRQMILPQIGEEGQAKLRAASVLVIGCGALGSVMCEQLVRAGVGFLRIADRDIVEWTNLQRQVLFTEEDAKHGVPKALAAAQRLREINSDVIVEPAIIDVDSGNVEGLTLDPHINLILDGTDNIETRYLINDAAVKSGVPWIYVACIGTEGRMMAVLPGKTPCLRCVFPNPPDARELQSCDTAGVLGPAASMVASLASTAAIRLLSGNESQLAAELLSLDVWRGRIKALDLREARRADCICCGQKQFEFLGKAPGSGSAKLCGRAAVQVRPTMPEPVQLEGIGAKLANSGNVETSRFFVRGVLNEPAGITLTVFADGRAIISGTDDLARARSIYARFVGA